MALPGLFSSIVIGHEGLSPSYKQLPSGFAYQTPEPERRTLQLTYPVSSSSRMSKDKASLEAANQDHVRLRGKMRGGLAVEQTRDTV